MLKINYSGSCDPLITQYYVIEALRPQGRREKVAMVGEVPSNIVPVALQLRCAGESDLPNEGGNSPGGIVEIRS